MSSDTHIMHEQLQIPNAITVADTPDYGGVCLEDALVPDRPSNPEQRNAAFASLGKRLNSARTPLEAARIIVDVADEMIGWDAASLDLYSAETGCVTALVACDLIDGERRDVPPAYTEQPPSPLARNVIEHGALIAPLAEHDRSSLPRVSFGQMDRPSASVMLTPIRGTGRVIGVLSIHSYTYDAYDEADLRTLENLAEHCGGALERTRAEMSLRDSERRLRLSQKMEAVGQLAGGIAHDFGNLLVAIMGYGELVYNALPSNDPARSDVAEILRASERAVALTRKLLTFSSKHAAQLRPVSLNDVIRSIVSMLGLLVGESVRIVEDLDANLELVHAEPAQIEQVLVNLAVNARDAMPDGGIVRIQTRNVTVKTREAVGSPAEPGEYVLLAVEDYGCGMDQATLSRLFEPFFTTKDVGQGTGLGLSVVYGIIKQAGGEILVTSELDKGTRVSIYLPVFVVVQNPAVG